MKHSRSAREIFATNLRRERLAKDWSQMELADAAGLHFTYALLGAYKKDHRNTQQLAGYLASVAAGEPPRK